MLLHSCLNNGAFVNAGQVTSNTATVIARLAFFINNIPASALNTYVTRAHFDGDSP